MLNVFKSLIDHGIVKKGVALDIFEVVLVRRALVIFRTHDLFGHHLRAFKRLVGVANNSDSLRLQAGTLATASLQTSNLTQLRGSVDKLALTGRPSHEVVSRTC